MGLQERHAALRNHTRKRRAQRADSASTGNLRFLTPGNRDVQEGVELSPPRGDFFSGRSRCAILGATGESVRQAGGLAARRPVILPIRTR
jgi:hypothetical protein